MAVPTHINTAGAQGGAITTNTNWYATTANNDIGVETMAVSGAGAAATVPSGWSSPISDVTVGTYRLITTWKRCGVNEPNHAWSAITGTNRFILSTVIRGCPTSGDPWDVLTDGTAAASTSMSIALGTTVYSDCLYLVHIGNPGSCTVASGAAANLSSVTEQYDTATTSNSRHAFTGGLATAGAGGTLTGTFSSSLAAAWMVIALKSTTSTTGGTVLGGRKTLLGVGR